MARKEWKGIQWAANQTHQYYVFFIKDRAREVEIYIVYCPTNIMVADHFTKPLQGSFFIKLRNVIMSYSHPITLLKILPSSDEERVEIITNLAISDDVKFRETIRTKLESRNGPFAPHI